MADDPDDYVARVLAARAPEIVDHVVSFEVLQLVLETINALNERMAKIEQQIESQAAGGVENPGDRAGSLARKPP